MSAGRPTTRRPASAPAEQPLPPRPAVAIKGSGAGLRVVVQPAADPEAVRRGLADQLARQRADFFSGAAALLELPAGHADWVMVADMADALAKAGIRLNGVQLGGVHRPPAEADGGSVVETTARRRNPPPPAPARTADEERALWVRRTLRSGQRLAYDGDVIIVGDVNAGAEVVAGGSVLVWGRLRGTVEAGLADGEDPTVCALDLAPTQLRIGNAIARAPEEPDRVPEPEMARAVGGRIVVDAWH